jgi:lipopolysaccharide export system protein LptA
MAAWQRAARVALASFALTFAIALLYSMSDRDGPPVAALVAPGDPEAVLESRSARITLGDGSVIAADRQFAYDDGSARLLGVEVVVPAGEDRTGFRIRSGEADGIEETGEWRLAGSVVIETADGLSGGTAEASYADATGIVTMPEPARFEQGWMRLEGDAARYERRRGVVHLDRRAVVELRPTTDGGAPTRIAATSAVVDRLGGVMRFTGGVDIDGARRRMRAERVVVRFDPDASRVDAIELAGGARVMGREGGGTGAMELSAQRIAVTYGGGGLEAATLSGDARIRGRDTGSGRLRELSAPTLDVSYQDGVPERVTMSGGARVELFGEQAGVAGLTIAGAFVEMALDADGAGIDELHAKDQASLAFPTAGGARRSIRARTVDIGSGTATEQTTDPPIETAVTSPAAADDVESSSLSAVFDGDVEMHESGAEEASVLRGDRIMRADRLEAALAEGLARLTEARFSGRVTLEAGGLGAQADRAVYTPDEALFTLLRADPAGASPRMDDERGFVQAETLAIDLDGPDIEATEDVRGVLREIATAETSAVRPGLFADDAPIHFVAGSFLYDAEQSLATYDGGARLWQGLTEFRGGRVVVDENTGNITAEGAVQTRTTMLQQDAELEQAVEIASAGSGGALFYDNQLRQATYTTGARLDSPGFGLGGDRIELFLHEDARTLERIRAADNVTLDLDTRKVTAASLVYNDAEGRYDLTGEPVSVIEQRAGACRETTGRTVTFYSTGDSISADGQSAERTASGSGSC